MIRLALFLTLALPFLGNCAPPREEISLGPPRTQALRTTELAADANQRIATLAAQLPITANSIFTAYAPRGKSQWSPGWPRRIDLTGVSWSQKQAGTAITPRHLVLAAHYGIQRGTEVTFHDRSGNPHKRTIIDVINLNREPGPGRSDVNVSLLDTPLPPSIKIYRLLPPRSDYGHTLPGCPAFVTDQNRQLFIHRIARQTETIVAFQKNPDLPDELYKSLVAGDSGNPSFLLVGGEPVLIETHTGGGPGSGPFYSNPAVFADIEKAVAKLDSNYRIQTIPLHPQLAPEPAAEVVPARQKLVPENAPQNIIPKPRVRRVPESAVQ